MKDLLRLCSFALLAGGLAGAQQLQIPPRDAGNFDECFNSDGDGFECRGDLQRSGAWITGDSDGVKDVTLTDGGQVVISTGSYRTHVVDYRVQFNQGDSVCGAEPIVETPHHAPFVLEFSRYFRTRASYVDHGLTKGWKDNLLFLFSVTNEAGFRVARLEVPTGAEMNWIDVGYAGIWTEDNAGLQSMVLALADEPGDRHLVTDRWGGKYHFVPNTGSRPNLQYLLDWLEDENGNRITVTYDVQGYPTQAADGFGRVLRYTYAPTPFDGVRHLITVQQPDGGLLRFQYFFDGLRSYKLTYPDGDVATYGVGDDADGHYYFFNDPRGEAGRRKDRVYTYTSGPGFTFETGRVRGIKDETGHVQLIRLESPGDAGVTIEYDDGRGFLYDCVFSGLSETITNLRTGAVTTKEWQANGDLLKKNIDPLGHWTTYDYDDDLALQVLRRNPNGTSETWSYDALNRVTDHVDPNGNPTHYDYDARGNLVRTTYADGSFEEWARDGAGHVTAHADRDGRTTSYTYDTRGNVAQIVRPAEPLEPNPVDAYTYDVNGRALTHTDPVGRVTSYAYDALGRPTVTTYPDGSTAEVTYGSMDPGSSTDPVDTAGLVVSRTDRNGNVTAYEYGANDRLVRESGAPGEILYTYDAQDRFVARGENGDVQSYGYDAAYRRTSLTRVPDSTHVLTTTYQYDLLDRVVVETDAHGFATSTTYDGGGEIALRTRQIGGPFVTATSATYDGNGNVLTRTDNGRVRTFLYDTNGRLLREYDPAPFDANFVEYAYDFEGHRLSRTDQLGNTTYSGGTSRGKPAFESDPSGVTRTHKYFLDDGLKETTVVGTLARTSYTYACCGRVATRKVVVDGGAQDILESFTYDGNGNVTQYVDGGGNAWTREYDARNRLVREVDPLGEATLTAYSDDGSTFDPRLGPGQGSAVTVTDPDGHAATTVYDGVGRVLREIDEVGASTVLTHDVPSGSTIGTSRTDRGGHTLWEYRSGVGLVVRTQDGLGNETRFLRDANGNQVWFVDARNGGTSFTYDALDRLVQVDYPGPDDVVTHSYLANGWLAQETDQIGNTTQYTYDPAGRLLVKRYQDGSEDVLDYDLGGRLTGASSGIYGNSVTLFRDKADRVVREVSTREVRMEYDRRSLETKVTTPSGRVFEKTYTARGELDLVRSGATVYADHDYDAAGNLVQRTLGNGTSSTWTHEPQDWIKTIRHSLGALDLLTLKYSYDSDGKKLAQRNATNESRHEFYAYDAAERLVLYRGKAPPVREFPATGPLDPLKGASKSQTWVLDPVSNWDETRRNNVPEQRLHSATNAIAFIVGVGALEYDKNGNLTDDGTYTYSYDFNDRLREVRQKVDDSPVAQYSYDALGRRVARTALEKSTIAQRRFVYFYDGDRVVELRERPDIGEPDEFRAAFAHGTRLDETLVMVRASNTFYYHHNSALSTVALTNQSGALVERYEYDPYGRTQVLDPTWLTTGDTSGVLNFFTFQGREADAEAGLIYFRLRSLSPLLGRYLTRNPAGYAGGPNLYSAGSLVNGWSCFGMDG